MLYKNMFLLFCLSAFIFLAPELGLCSVEGSLDAIKTTLLSRIIPAAAILAFIFSALLFFMGSPNARTYLIASIVGAIVAFGSSSILQFIQSLIN